MRKTDNANIVETLSWDAVAARIARGASAILPIGAGAKEHGFHLPMNTDRIQAEALAARLADRIDALIWPVVSYGYYPAFTNYAGSCSLSAETFEKLIEEVVSSLLGDGVGAVFVLDTGISTMAPVARALTRIDSDKVRHLTIHDGARYKAAAEKISEQDYGSHADERETSIMLALAPHLVDLARAEASPSSSRDARGPLTPANSASPSYSRSGSFGDPTLATRAKGEILLAAMMDDLVEQSKAFLAGLASANSPQRKSAGAGEAGS